MTQKKFCDQCENVLRISEDAQKRVSLYCEDCQVHIPFSGGLIAEKKYKTTKNYDEMLFTALYDDTLPRVRTKCSNCPNDIIIYFRDKSTMKNIYFCRSCRNYWQN